jgi:hypothetical protein
LVWLDIVSKHVVHSEPLEKNGSYHTTRSDREEAPSEASS